MNKQQWQELYQKLQSIHSEFSIAYSNYKNGKNKKIRADAERDVEHAIRIADFYIRQSSEAFELLTGGPDTTDWGRTISYDEFKQFRYFGNDMQNFLAKIKDKIDSIEK